MSIACPVCYTEYQEGPPDLCMTCGWSMALDLIALDRSSETLKSFKMIDWAKQVWVDNQRIEMRAKQAEIAIADRQNQIDDCYLRIDLLTRLFKKSSVEKEEALKTAEEKKNESIFQLEVEIAQLRQTFQNIEVENQKIQSDLQSQLSHRQTQIKLLKGQSQQLNIEKDRVQKNAHDLEIEIIQLKHLLQNVEIINQQLQNQLDDHQMQIELLQHRIQTIETGSEKLKTTLRQQQNQNRQKQQVLKSTLDLANAQRKEISQREGMAQVQLLQWLQSELFDRFINEIANINNRTEALANINSLQRRRLNQEWQNSPANSFILQLVIDLFSQKQLLQQVSKDELQAGLDKYGAIILVEAILVVLAELKIVRLP